MNEDKDIITPQQVEDQVVNEITNTSDVQCYTNPIDAIDDYEWCFKAFLHKVENLSIETNITSKGETTIQQTPRNELRREGLAALKADLITIYGDEFDIVETKEGLIIVAENEPGDFTFSWELKNTIKSIDFDPFIEANNFEEEQLNKQAKKLSKARDAALREQMLKEKRQRKLEELERRNGLVK